MSLLDCSIYDGIEALGLQVDVQGWHSTHPIFRRLIAETRPHTIIEVGTWKGASALHMAELAREIWESPVIPSMQCANLRDLAVERMIEGIDEMPRQTLPIAAGVAADKAERWHIYCVDTWLGAREIWNNPNLRAQNPRKHGYPQVYFQFLHNVKAAGFEYRITPVPATSRIGAGMLLAAGVARAELIYIDASHDFVDVLHDLKTYWQFLPIGGVMFGDDCGGFPGVRVAVDTFCADKGIEAEIVAGNFWVLRRAA